VITIFKGKAGMTKLFHKFMVFLAEALVSLSIFQWLKAYDDSRLSFWLDSDILQPEILDAKSLWWCKARREAK
jgi:hypothetical protein